MREFRICLLLSICAGSVSNAFFTSVTSGGPRRQQSCEMLRLPTLEQLSTDPFMKQVQHGTELSNVLRGNSIDLPPEDLKKMIQAQLSHSDGIRGLMVAYLTFDEDNQDTFKVPDVLVEALQEQTKSNPEELIPLAFMNVIMPTAMTTMHQEEELRRSSSRTAHRGLCVLEALVGQHSSVEDNAKAILHVASKKSEKESGASPALIKYWEDFFKKWGYEESQKSDISETMATLLQSKF